MSYFIIIGLYVAAFMGWILNIIAIFNSGPVSEWTGVTITRVAGIFIAPLGAVMGWF